MKTYFKDMARSHKKFVGQFYQSNSEEFLEMLAYSGQQFIIIDTEHGGNGLIEAVQMIKAADAAGVANLVRLSNANEEGIKTVLDAGTSGIVIPNIASRAMAEEAVRLAKYPPLGTRGSCPFVRANSFGLGDHEHFYADENRKCAVFIHIEDREGVEHMEEIISTPGIDAVTIGIVDLSVDLEIPGQVNHPLIMDAVKKCCDLCHKYDRITGIFTYSPDEARSYLRDETYDFDFVWYGPPSGSSSYREIKAAVE